MRLTLVFVALLLSTLPTPASAKACLKGALVGGVAGAYGAGDPLWR